MKLKFWKKAQKIKKKKKSDFYIRILKWAAKQDNFTIQKLYRELKITSVYIKSWIDKEIEKEKLFINVGYKKFKGGKMYPIYKLSFDARFKLLEFEELSFARANAKEARAWAIRAVTIAIISLFLLITLSLVDYFSVQNVKLHDTNVISVTDTMLGE